MKMRTVIGGAMVLAFVVGGYLGGFIPKLGWGPGNGIGGGGDGDEKSHENRLVSAESKKPKTVIGEEVDPKVLHVRIDGRNYALVKADGDQPVPLEELLEQVQHFPGNRQGIRVRVSRTPASRTTAEIQLRDALVNAGLSEEEIDWQDGPRP